jgi:hypothetical protein
MKNRTQWYWTVPWYHANHYKRALIKILYKIYKNQMQTICSMGKSQKLGLPRPFLYRVCHHACPTLISLKCPEVHTYKLNVEGSFGTHHFILFGRNEMKWHDDIISFGKSTEMTGYPIGIKIRHKMKSHGIRNECHNQFCGSQTSIC